jgi:membrane-bound lytic murein transglycosylase A
MELLLCSCGAPKALSPILSPILNPILSPPNDSDESIQLTALPGFSGDDLKGLAEAIDHQCKLVSPPTPWQKLCLEFATERADLKAWLTTKFSAWPLLGNNGNAVGLITGYYEPLLKGSRYRENTSKYRSTNDLSIYSELTAWCSPTLRERRFKITTYSPAKN